MALSSSKITIRALLSAALITTSSVATSAEYWVGKSGSDSNGCTNKTSDTCFTIQKGVSLLAAGDILNVKAGTYSDDGGNSAYKPSGVNCGWIDSTPPSSSVCIDLHASASNPITIQAAPGDEGKVIIDSQGSRLGFHLQHSDYIHIRGFNFINTSVIAIATWGQPYNSVADEDLLSVGVVIENNQIIGVEGPSGKNVSGVGMWSSKNWLVRNNRIDDVSVAGGQNASGIQAYGTINALIENNHITNARFGVYWKDHFLLDASGNGVPVVNSEIRFNLIEDIQRGFYVAGANEQAGYNNIHHNIFRNYSESGVYINHKYNSFPGQAKDLTISHNLFDGSNNAGVSGIWNDVYLNTRITGNIFARNTYSINFHLWSDPTEHPELLASDYNVFHSSFGKVRMDGYNGPTYSSLSAWQSALAANSYSLGIDNPGQNSVTRSAADIDERRNLRIMANGSSAGPYQYGTEIVGLLGEYFAAIPGPMPPGQLSIKVY
ncbi:hypothetical protein N9211_02495 [Pseudomonadales bacterium]|nr:hypothetical protein [Pseudomonadales bacterium]